MVGEHNKRDDVMIRCVRCGGPAKRTMEGHLICVDCGRVLVTARCEEELLPARR